MSSKFLGFFESQLYAYSLGAREQGGFLMTCPVVTASPIRVQSFCLFMQTLVNLSNDCMTFITHHLLIISGKNKMFDPLKQNLSKPNTSLANMTVPNICWVTLGS